MYYHLKNDHKLDDIDDGGVVGMTIHPWLLFTMRYLFTTGYCSDLSYHSVVATVANG
jgi:hypothetical protein